MLNTPSRLNRLSNRRNKLSHKDNLNSLLKLLRCRLRLLNRFRHNKLTPTLRQYR